MNEQPQATVTWAGLSEGEREALKEYPETDYIVPVADEKEMVLALTEKGLFDYRYNDHMNWVVKLTDLGKRILAQATVQVTVITAAQFVEQGYAAKVAAGECTVTMKGDSNLVKHINTIQTAIDHTSYVVVFNDNWTLSVGSDKLFSVYTPATATPAAEDGAIDWQERALKAETELLKLTNELSRNRELLMHMSGFTTSRKVMRLIEMALNPIEAKND